MDAYNELKALHLRLYRLQHLASLGDWDMNTMMPPRGAESRGAALAELRRVMHQLHTAPRVKELLSAALLVLDDLPPVDQANLREMARLHRLETCVPEELLARKLERSTANVQLWRECREHNDVARWLPALQEMVLLAREEAEHLARESGSATRYDALLWRNEPGLTVARLDALYADIKSWLPALYREVLENHKDVSATIVPLVTPIAEEQQVQLGLRLMALWQHEGRLDKAPHPFAGNVKEDVRVTAYYSPDNYTKGVMATIHETGHAKYEMLCGPREMLGQPVCNARSGGVHESQSLLAERMIARTASFAHVLTPLLVEVLGAQPGLTVENVLKMNQRVQPSLIRTLADDLGNPLHVILRYEIERDLVNGVLEAADVPRVWEEKLQTYLGLSTEGRHDLGCLQDIHWAAGGLGSFPAYSIGSIGSAQIMAAIRRELGDAAVEECIHSGRLGPILAKQKEKVWDQGCIPATVDALLVKATGEPLNPRHLREQLERRYLRHEA